MKECNFENQIDNYLLGKMSDEKKGMFEDHYFNCHSCFEKVEARNSLISVIKSKGKKIFHDYVKDVEEEHGSLFERLFSFLTPKQWTMAAVSACALLLVVIGIVPVFDLKSPTPPQFVMDSQSVRGGSLALISPVNTTQTIPTEFKWENLGEDIEYKIYIYKDTLLWSASTTRVSISLPENVKGLLKAGEIYSWEVKAFSQEGSLIAASSKEFFQIDSHQ